MFTSKATAVQKEVTDRQNIVACCTVWWESSIYIWGQVCKPGAVHSHPAQNYFFSASKAVGRVPLAESWFDGV